MVRSVYKMRWTLSDRIRFTSGRRFLLLSAIGAVHFAFEAIVSSLTDPMAAVSHLLAIVALVEQNSCSVGDLRTMYTRNALIAPSFLPCTSSRAPQKTRPAYTAGMRSDLMIHDSARDTYPKDAGNSTWYLHSVMAGRQEHETMARTPPNLYTMI